MSRRRNGTNKAAAKLGLSVNNPFLGNARKRSREYKAKKDPLLLEQQEDQAHKK